jgi:hypothetical protein
MYPRFSRSANESITVSRQKPVSEEIVWIFGQAKSLAFA